MAIHSTLPIYKVTYDLLRLVTEFSRNMPRDFKASLGGKIREECVDLVVLIYRANCSFSKTTLLDEMLERLQVIELMLRLSRDLHFGLSLKMLLTLKSFRDYSASVTLNSVTGIGVLNGAAKSRNVFTLRPFCCFGMPSYGRPSGRGRKAHRCSIGTPTSASVAHPIGVGLAVKTATGAEPWHFNTKANHRPYKSHSTQLPQQAIQPTLPLNVFQDLAHCFVLSQNFQTNMILHIIFPELERCLPMISLTLTIVSAKFSKNTLSLFAHCSTQTGRAAMPNQNQITPAPLFCPVFTEADIQLFESKYNGTWGVKRRTAMAVLSLHSQQLIDGISKLLTENNGDGFLALIDQISDYRDHLKDSIETAECALARLLSVGEFIADHNQKLESQHE